MDTQMTTALVLIGLAGAGVVGILLTGSALGFTATAVTLALLWRRTHARRETP